MAAFSRKLLCFCANIRPAVSKIRVSPVSTSSCLHHGTVNSRRVRPFLRQMYKRRLEVGPEPERPRSAWINWNYDAEIFAFGKRLGEDFDEDILRRAFVHRSYIEKESRQRAEAGFGADMAGIELQDNQPLVKSGREITSSYVQAFLRSSYPYLPEEGIRSIHDHLMSDKMLAFVGGYLGVKDLTLAEDFPPLESTLAATFLAVVGALAESQDEERAKVLVRDFLLPKLQPTDINELWPITSPMTLLTDVLQAQGQPAPEARLIRESASSTVMSLYWVGLYCNKQLIGEAPGETVTIAEEMAARDALKEIFRTTDHRAPLNYGMRGRSLEVDEGRRNLTVEEYSQPQSSSSDRQ